MIWEISVTRQLPENVKVEVGAGARIKAEDVQLSPDLEIALEGGGCAEHLGDGSRVA